MDIRKAIDFVENRGSPFEKARLYNILRGEIPDSALMRPLLETQSKDGGFPSRPRPGNISSVDSTLTALWKLDEVGLFHSSAAQRALQFLMSVQRSDGSWDENPALPAFDLAPWIIPGNPATRLYLTAYSAYYLGLSEYRAEPAFEKAARYLAAAQEETGKVPGYQHNSWIGAAAFFLAGADYQKQARLALDYLAGRPAEDWEDSQIAWALDCLGRAGLLPDEPFIAAGLDLLRSRQDEDGSWASEDGVNFIITATLQAIRVFARYEIEA